MNEQLGNIVFDGRIQENLAPIYDKLDDISVKLEELEELILYVTEKLNEIGNNQ